MPVTLPVQSMCLCLCVFLCLWVVLLLRLCLLTSPPGGTVSLERLNSITMTDNTSWQLAWHLLNSCQDIR